MKAWRVCHLFAVLTGGNLVAYGEHWEKVRNLKAVSLLLTLSDLGHVVAAEKQS